MSEIRFSPVHGQNLQLEDDGKKAAWKLNKHGGCCFTNRALAKGDNVTFTITGSGHVFLGVLGSRPRSIRVMNEDATSLDKTSHWTHLRLKKEGTSITLHRGKSNEISYIRKKGNTPEKKTVPVIGKEPYICFEILFGDICIGIDCSGGVKKQLFFDEECGVNVSLLQQQSRAQLKNINPGAMCCTNRPLRSWETVELDVKAVADASWTFIKLFIANSNTDATEIQNLQSTTGLNLLFPRNGIQIDKKGSIQICLTEHGEMSYSVDTVSQNVVIDRSVVDQFKPVYLYLELFRSRVGMRSTIAVQEEATYLRIIDSPSRDEDDYLTPVQENKLLKSHVDVPTGFPERPRDTNCSGSWYLRMESTKHEQQTTPKVFDADSSNTEMKKPVDVGPSSIGVSKTASRSSQTKLKHLEGEPQGSLVQGTRFTESQDSITKLKQLEGEPQGSLVQGTRFTESHDSITKLKQFAAKPEERSGGNDLVGDTGKDSVNRKAGESHDSENKRLEAEPQGHTGTLVVESHGLTTKAKNLCAQPEDLNRNNLPCRNDGRNKDNEIPKVPPRPPRTQEPEGACGPLPLPPRVPVCGGTDGPEYLNEIPTESSFENTIRRNYTDLIDRLMPDFLADLLFEKGNMSGIEHSDYLDLQDRKSKCRVVLKILLSRPSSVSTFKEALRRSAQADILTMLQLE